MARAIWKGVLVLGDVRVGVKFYSAVQDRDVHFRLLHDQDLVPVKQRMVNAQTGEPVEREQVSKAAPVSPGRLVLVRPDELAPLTPADSREVVIERFVPSSQINHQWYVRPYFLGPDDGAADDVAALAAALREAGVQGIARWVMRRQRYLGALGVQRGALAMLTLRHAEQIVPVGELDIEPARAASEAERRMAGQLVEALAADFQPQEFHDEYRQRVLSLIEAKAKGRPLPRGKPQPEPRTDEPLTRMLQASLRRVQRQHPASERAHGRR
jgi:DNA end-binding protein Ku